MPRRYPFYMVLAWLCLAALALLWLAFPTHTLAAWLATLALAALGLAAATLHHRRRVRETERVREALGAGFDELAGVAAGAREDAIYILVVGEHGARLFGESANASPRVTYSDNAFWIQVSAPSALAPLSRAITRWRAGRRPEAVMLALGPECCDERQEMASRLQAWRYALADMNRRLSASIPFFISLYTNRAGAGRDAFSLRGWFGLAAEAGRSWDNLPALRGQLARLKQNLDDAGAGAVGPEDRFLLARRGAKARMLLDWLDEMVLPPLYGPRTGLPAITLSGLILAEADLDESGASPWGAWQYLKTALAPKAHRGEAKAPFPPQISLALPKRAQPSQWLRAACHMGVIAALASAAAIAGSAWCNRALAERVFADIEVFHKIDYENRPDKEAALAVLEEDRRELYAYKLSGPPSHMGWKLYRGPEILPPLEAAIASYIPPPPPEPEVVFVPQPTPPPMVLDSVALFDSGKAALKAGAEESLHPVLETVMENRDKFFLVTGHTDNVGSPELNQKLSEARAVTVRDWLAAHAHLPPSRFGIRGYGDAKPLAENDSEAGKARNRRVEVAIVSSPVDE